MLADRKLRLKEALMSQQEFDVIAGNLHQEIEAIDSLLLSIGELSVDWNELKKILIDVKVKCQFEMQ